MNHVASKVQLLRAGVGCALLGRPATVCLGVGIVRAVDMAKGRAYVLAPFNVDTMQQVDVLQVQFPRPRWILKV